METEESTTEVQYLGTYDYEEEEERMKSGSTISTNVNESFSSDAKMSLQVRLEIDKFRKQMIEQAYERRESKNEGSM